MYLTNELKEWLEKEIGKSFSAHQSLLDNETGLVTDIGEHNFHYMDGRIWGYVMGLQHVKRYLEDTSDNS